MSRGKTVFFCTQCGYESPKWLGKCPGCGEWNQMAEELRSQAKGSTRKGTQAKAQSLSSVSDMAESARISTGSIELDRVLGGGMVPGSLVLIGGDPGIGKSTLVLQAARGLGAAGKKVLYVAGEESPAQLQMRARRLGVTNDILILAETDMTAIEEQVLAIRPDVVIVDSIQTVYRPELTSAAGSVSQLKEATATWMRLAKNENIAVMIIGHVTKEGQIAGPRLLEHMVDCVLYFEGDRQHLYRILRAVKNRFGSTHEIGLFTMETSGLKEVANPSEWLLSQRPANAPGSVVTASMEGTRPLLVEIQALVTPSRYGGNSRRMATGVDLNRVSLILAVLERHIGLQILDYDVFVNAAGGVRLLEPAVDLAVAASLLSSFRDRPVAADTLFVGEVGLAGEVRGVPHLEQRLHEGARLGFKRAVVPKYNVSGLRDGAGMELVSVSTLDQACSAV
ncbi:DNA repair protein RadA [Dethiobacter alkaliphilus]|uniref:DNA repair protein RadA n=1 Tax=Dethiobacter alkaliphilus TaxID=427926 RepID=UPI0022273B6D|nr:DNA repair protein RadA [Dethiobacter alkaliphilus]MCW3491392.1 DNA repair protein RadA [Dethiobacter alkaliphilus]